MLASLSRLFQLRPFLTMVILGIPVIVLVMVGLFTIFALKLLVFVVLPIIAVVWLVRKVFRRPGPATCGNFREQQCLYEGQYSRTP